MVVSMSMPKAKQLVSRQEVAAGYDRLAKALQPVIDKQDCVLIGVLRGGMIPLVNIVSRLKGDFQLDYCHATRYSGKLSGGDTRWVQKPQLPLDGKTVVLIDDIFDEGRTLAFIADYCTEAGANLIVTAVLVRKDHDRSIAGISPDFTGLTVEDSYLFGCGMDYQERWRHLPEIYGLSDESCSVS